jgi:hypothetical protein
MEDKPARLPAGYRPVEREIEIKIASSPIF